MSGIYATIHTPEMTPWSAEDVAKAQAIPGTLSVVVAGMNDCCITFEMPGDCANGECVANAKQVVSLIAKAFPGVSVKWTTTTASR